MLPTRNIFDVFRFAVKNKSDCGACGIGLYAKRGYRVPGVSGAFCSVLCIEAALFGGAHCRWCGQCCAKPYSSVRDRLCSPACEEQFFAHVHGDHTADLGRGVRLLLWLSAHQPELHRRVIGAEAKEGYCQNPKCPRGEYGQPASLEHLRSGTKFCCEACSEQARRNAHSQEVLTGHFDPSQTRQKCGFSRHVPSEMGLGVNPSNFAVSRHDPASGARGARATGAQR